VIGGLAPVLAAAGPPSYRSSPKGSPASRETTSRRELVVANVSSRFGHGCSKHLELTGYAVGLGMLIAGTAAIIAYKHDWVENDVLVFARINL